MKKSILKKIGGLFLGLAMGLGVATGVTAENKASEVKAATTSSLSIETYATDNKWSDGTAYSTINFNEFITITGKTGGNNNKYYTSNKSWRQYEGDSAQITISTTNSITLKSVIFTYASAKNGVLKYSNVNKTSGTEISLSGTSASFTVGHSSGSSNGNIQITNISISYESAPTKELVSISVSGTPTKTEYYVDDTFNPQGLVVTGTYSDTSTGTILSGITWTCNPTKLKTTDTSCSVVAKVGEIESEAYVVNGLTVKMPKLSSLSFTSRQTSFSHGDTFTIGDDATITAYYETFDETIYSNGNIQSNLRGELVFKLLSKNGDKYTDVKTINVGEEMLRSYNNLYTRAYYTYGDTTVYSQAAQITVSAPDVQVAVEEETTAGYSKITNSTQLTIGSTVVLACEEVSMEMTSISTSDAKYGIGTSFSGSPEGTFSFNVKAGSESGSFSFKNGDNYLRWNSGNSLDTVATSAAKNSSWFVTFDGSGNAKLTNANDSTRFILWNVGSPRFATYTGKSVGNSYYAIQLYKYSSGGMQENYYTCSPELYDAIAASQALLDEECTAKNVTSSTWATISGMFESFKEGDDYKILTKGKSLSKLDEGNIVQDFLARYDQIVHDYGYSNFLNRAEVSGSRINPIISLSNVDNSVWIIAVIALAGLTCIGGYFFYRKRKENI